MDEMDKYEKRCQAGNLLSSVVDYIETPEREVHYQKWEREPIQQEPFDKLEVITSIYQASKGMADWFLHSCETDLHSIFGNSILSTMRKIYDRRGLEEFLEIYRECLL
jgi:hypothetical protein